MDIYLDASRLGIYPPLFTSPSGDSCILQLNDAVRMYARNAQGPDGSSTFRKYLPALVARSLQVVHHPKRRKRKNIYPAMFDVTQ